MRDTSVFNCSVRACVGGIAIGAVLTACGGGNSSADSSAIQTGGANSSAHGAQAVSRSVVRLEAPDAALTQQSLADAESIAVGADPATRIEDLRPGLVAPKVAYLLGNVARKAAAVRTLAYRFFNGSTGAHFYTTSTNERDTVQANLSPPFSYEGGAFSVASAFSPGLSPVHRFFNAQTGVHFYTISDSERANVVATLPQYNYEGVAYHASQVAGAGFIPFYRFYVPSRGFHFYTASEEEKDSIQTNLSAIYSFEGVGYNVLDTDWRAVKLPHTGVSSSQCYEAGNGVTVVPCSANGAIALNPHQDGHRTSINPMSYSMVGSNPSNRCVLDDVTGLIWESKTDDGGLQDKDNTYTNLGNLAATDASGYVSAINAAKLCGFGDWRIPSRNELLGIVDYSRTQAPMLNTTAFPNASGENHWTADLERYNQTRAWFVEFSKPWSYPDLRSNGFALRLVRGGKSAGSRFMFSTVAYENDQPNNVVNDAWTGLQWRRCEQGRTWDGAKCTGNTTVFLHEPALEHARQQTGWRLPNIKELTSITDLNSPYDGFIDPLAFPSAQRDTFWSSSPYGANVSSAMTVNINTGSVSNFTRHISTNDFGIRLVRVDP